MPATLFQSPEDESVLRIVPLGGCGEFGMNLTAYLARGKLFVVDCGVKFPDPSRLGVDAILPHVDPWFESVGGVYAYFLTHGHEDHLGALPHVVRKWPAPIYGTAWTAELFANKLEKLGVDPAKHPMIVVEPGDRVRAHDLEVEYVHVNHSIPMACALFIRTPGLNVFHTGDFKYEARPLLEAPMNFARLSELGDEGVDLLLADSTNAEKPGVSPSEAEVLKPLRDVFQAAKGAVVVTTFSSNLWRLKTIADACQAAGRRLCVSGAGAEATLRTGAKLGLYSLPEKLRLPEEQVINWPREKLVVLATGCQGERRASLARIAAGEHRWFKLAEGDAVVLSSRIIPGNERAISSVLDGCRRRGAEVITTREAPGIHVTGHAHSGDLRLLTQALRPRHFVPVHGAYGQLSANLEHARRNGLSPANSRLVETGDVFDVSRGSGVTVVGQIEVELSYVDGESAVILSHMEMKERLRIGELGLIIVSGVFATSEKKWLASPECDWVGVRAIDEESGARLESSLIRTVEDELPRLIFEDKLADEAAFEELRILLRRQLAAVLHKKPVVKVKLHLV